MDKKIDYLIIGAGISGLAFATQKRNSDYIIIERDSVPGGLCQSFHEKGFVWDVAGHFFHFHSDETKAYFYSLMDGRQQRTVRKCAKVYYDGHYMDAPFQYNIHQLPTEEFLQCLTDLYFANSTEDSVSFSEFVKSKYGNGIASKFLIPYNEKLYACKMEKLEKDSMGEFLPRLDFGMLMSFYRGSVGKTYNDTFNYPVNGCVEIINALLQQIDNSKIRYNESVIDIDIKGKTVHTTKGEYHYEHLINSAPLSSLATMIYHENAFELNYNQVLVLNMGFDNGSIDKQVSWVYYPGDEIFYRVGFYNNIADTERLSIYVEIGYKSNETINIQAAIDKTLIDLRRVNVIDNHVLLACKPYIINPGYAHITSSGQIYTESLMSKLESNDVYMIGRYARWQYSAMDDSIEQALELAKRI